MNPSELAWAAGFFDGEGTTCVLRGHPDLSRRKRRSYCQLNLTVGQKERTTLDRFRSAVGGLGKVRGPYQHDPRRPTSLRFTYQVQRWTTVQQVVALLWSYLSEPKRQQIRKAFSTWRLAWRPPYRFTSESGRAARMCQLRRGGKYVKKGK